MVALIHLPVRLVPSGTCCTVTGYSTYFAIRFLQRPVAVEERTSRGFFPAIAVASHEQWHSTQDTLFGHDSGQTR